MLEWLRPRHVVVGLVAILCLVVVTWAASSRGSENHSQQQAAPSSATGKPSADPTVPAPSEPNPSSTQATKSRLDSRVKAFTAAYFSIPYPEGATQGDAVAKSAVASVQAIKPYVSKHFLETAPFGYEMFGSSAAGDSLVQAEASIKAEPTTGLIDAHITDNKAVGTVMVHFSKSDTNGFIDLGDKPQRLILVKQGNTWFVDSAPLT